jgi:rSAM/selenodomain-associated transferase 2
MKISVIIPTYNEANTIRKTLEQILETGGEFIGEVILVDGNSEDDTAGIAQAMGVTVLSNAERSRAAQMNEGAHHASCEILHFVHADTLVPDGFAEAILETVKDGTAMGNFRYDFDKESFLLSLNAYFTKYSWLVSQGGDKTFFIKKELFFEMGCYDPYWTIMEEYDFAKRAMAAGHRIKTLPQKCIVSARKYHNNSWARVQLANFVVFNLWKLRLAGPDRLKTVYGRILR